MDPEAIWAQIISNSAGRPGQQIVDFPTMMDLALRRSSETNWGLLQNDQQDDAHQIFPQLGFAFRGPYLFCAKE